MNKQYKRSSDSKIVPLTYRLAVLLVCLIAGPSNASDTAIDFSRDVRPLLSGKCFSCHGPDEESRQADLRLDSFAAATSGQSSSQAIVPGNPDDSEFVRRILSNDPDERMPPLSSNKSLTPDEKQILIDWIRSGATYEEHWAFVPPRRPEVPKVNNASWASNPIDHFILARLEKNGLSPSPAASPRTLVRRVFLDLIGIPPTPDEAEFWTNRLTDGAGRFDMKSWIELVDHLLTQPQYGERWGRRWLDLARYADTNGYEKDRDRTMWPYRDWVVRALNADMPFDQFTIEQLAGDMLPGATIDQRIATGFHRNTMLNEEGGIDPLEFRFYAMTDRVATTGATWLGLTTGCCQCHTHKYDPITHHEYFGLMAFLNNADEPDLNLPDPAAEERYQNRLAESDRLVKELPLHWPASDDSQREAEIELAFSCWLDIARAETPDWKVLVPSHMTSNLPHLTLERDGSVFASGDTTKFDTYELEFKDFPAGATAIRLEALPDQRLPSHGPGTTYYEGRKGDFFLNEFSLALDGQSVAIRSASHSYAKNQFGKNPVGAELTIDGDYQTGWSAAERPGKRSVAVYVLQRPLDQGSRLHLKMTFGRHFASSLGRFRISAAMVDGDVQAIDRPLPVEKLLRTAPDARTPEQRDQLFEAFLLESPEVADEAKKIRQLRNRPASVEVPVLTERPESNPRATFLHKRGEYLQPSVEVAASVPEILHDFPADRPRNRLEFARWLVSRRNPLTPRVVVNRHWAAFFGTGIVSTLDDFGMQGESPTHPELLDWLAISFMNDGWSLKRLHRQIVCSSTYRQSSRLPDTVRSPETGNVRDARLPSVRLLARFPRVRLEAEIIRDSILHASGLLSMKAGGPPVRPPQPDGVTEAAFGRPKWKASTGEDRYRRSIYTYQKRTAPFAMYAVFDAPSGEACVARRDVSNTALQALTLLNDEMFLEAARALGTSLSAESGTDTDRITRAFNQVLTRSPTDHEITRLLTFVETQRSHLRAVETEAVRKKAPADTPADTPDDAPDRNQTVKEVSAEKEASAETAPPKNDESDASKELPSLENDKSARSPDNPEPSEVPPVDEDAIERAVWTAVARALFSLDETLTKN